MDLPALHSGRPGIKSCVDDLRIMDHVLAEVSLESKHRSERKFLECISWQLYFELHKVFESKLTVHGEREQAACGISNIRIIQRRVRCDPVKKPRRRASENKAQIRHRPILPRPVYKRLRFQACRGYPRVSRPVPQLVLKGGS